MKLARYIFNGRVCYGVLEGDILHELARPPFGGMEMQGRKYDVGGVELLPPVFPQKIVAVGLNYRDHAEEFNLDMPDEPVLFMKPPTALLAHGGEIVYPEMSRRVDFEAELVLVCGRECRGITPEEAPAYVLGYTCGNDVTARDLQAKDGQWTRAKSFDTFCPLGPFVETDVDPSSMAIELRLNGEVRQSSNTANMAFGPAELLSFVSRIMTMLPGDVIMTGTPSGVGEMRPGDTVEVAISGLDTLRNAVV
ncbi:MAG: fumarylacetoacetate hydrolase family protein [Actinomycetota bacterium]|nr:fumarylacetoacetate hydrolase family protein [Actinomycetota bacterium]